MKILNCITVLALSCSVYQSHACKLSPKAYSEIQIKTALEFLPDLDTIKQVTIVADHVVIEHVDQRGICYKSGFAIYDGTGSCNFRSSPDTKVHLCK